MRYIPLFIGLLLLLFAYVRITTEGYDEYTRHYVRVGWLYLGIGLLFIIGSRIPKIKDSV